VYVSGNALVILGGVDVLLQTIYNDECEDLYAVALDETSGKLATCHENRVNIYKPYGKVHDVRWSLQCTFDTPKDGGHITTLSWGSGEELLVGAKSLMLFSTAECGESIWTKPLANDAKFALFSYDASFIASTGSYDKLVKVWRRLSYGSDKVLFDFTYLPHPAVVTGMHWRRPYHREQTIDNVLYTICMDNKLRIWAPTLAHDLQILQLWDTIDLTESISPRDVPLPERSSKRIAFIVDSKDFSTATERAVSVSKQGDPENHSLHHLIEVANRSPEVCVVFDDRGHMSAWGLENVGSKDHKSSSVFNIAHVQGLKLAFPTAISPDEDYVQVHNFCGKAGQLIFLAHYFDGRIEWLESKVDELFDPSPREKRMESKAIWTGHCGPLKKIVRSITGKALLSRTNDNEGLVWKQRSTETGVTLSRASSLLCPEHIHRTCILDDGNFVVLLHHQSISLWDARSGAAHNVGSCDFELEGKPLCIIQLPENTTGYRLAHVATISSKMKGIVWEIRLTDPKSTNGRSNGDAEAHIREFARFDLGEEDDLDFVLPVDPAGSVETISGFVDTFARDVAISYTKSGVLRSWTAKVDHENVAMHWLVTSKTETGVDNPSLASGTSIRKIALVDSEKTELTIWDSRASQLEFKERFEAQDVINDLDWTATPDNQSVLAIGFPHRVLLMSQLRFDYLEAGPCWGAIREIRIRELTPHPIGDSIWLSNGNFAIGAGNQLFVYDKEVEVRKELVGDLRLASNKPFSCDLFSLVSRLNGPLPVYHPQFLTQYMLSGKPMLVEAVLIALYKALKFFTEGEDLDMFLNISIKDLTSNHKVDCSNCLHIYK
jgi:WD40 repeat protein